MRELDRLHGDYAAATETEAVILQVIEAMEAVSPLPAECAWYDYRLVQVQARIKRILTRSNQLAMEEANRDDERAMVHFISNMAAQGATWH